MKRILPLILCIIWSTTLAVCPTGTAKPASPIDDLSAIVKEVLARVDALPAVTPCEYPLDKKAQLFNYVTRSGSDIDNTVSLNFYFLTDDILLQQVILDYQEELLTLLKSIRETTNNAGSRCIADVKFDTDIAQKSAHFPTKDVAVKEVLNNLYRQVRAVLSFYRSIVSGSETSVFEDTQPFGIVPLYSGTTFITAMRTYFSTTSLQQCVLNSYTGKIEGDKGISKYNKGIKDTDDLYENLKKKIFNDLLFPNSADKKIQQEEAQKKQQRLFLLPTSQGTEGDNSTEGTAPTNSTEDEEDRYTNRSGGLVGYYDREYAKIVGEIKELDRQEAPVSLLNTQNTSAIALAVIDTDNISDYLRRKTAVAENTVNNRKIVTWLSSSIDTFMISQIAMEHILAFACEIYSRQAINYPGRPTCNDLVQGRRAGEDYSAEVASGGNNVHVENKESLGTPGGDVYDTEGYVTTFGYKDSGDNGVGTPILGSINTNNTDVRGASLNTMILDQKFPGWRSDKAQQARMRDAWVDVYNPANGSTGHYKMVDVGPASWTGNSVDLTYAANQHMGGTGKTRMQFRVTDSQGNEIR